MGKRDKAFEEILKEIRYTYQYDPRVIEHVVRHLCRQTANIMRDKSEERPVRLKYWGVFALKKGAIKR